MKTKSDIENIAISALTLEAEAISKLTKNINEDFINTVHAILDIKGRVIITGIGKSAIIAQKIVATMNSTGTPAIFMHAADAIHGDLGMLQQEDIVIAISKSGNTPEIKVLVPLLKNSNAKIIAMVGNTKSYLAEQADFILDTTVSREACPLNLAPTTSTTAQLAMGDALAICLLECRSFTNDDFAKYHPGGALGKRLYLKVTDLARQNAKPEVKSDTPIKAVLVEITKNRLGAVAVVNDKKISGIITDGDIRRMLESNQDIGKLKAEDIMGNNPKVIQYDELAVHALNMMRNNHITQLLVVRNNQYDGIVHLHDLLNEGII
ncbi:MULTISPECIES: KpsF/GutQ family sugar-phosphate isomerase [Olivibacter]|uniref:KpsF/GutQ family protein n=3 Tax=Sphingobacteriaceae TaxID=84566 RepID=F4C704_SPHS2|nr:MULTISPECIES: KpsF/GutQ family sugar-phosphate isomerase [Olivibacter]MCL4639670.1 KpsF/GutQ family sugar-phosphate isomerase [Olivibacter sp. UJ_SKK_5.1]MDM8175218.1 KpsF/GutQ family sugar-phosphate isomerase [Olivibacter sp. 47]MDX3913105.1 KpsF/GutQ family sugar-phosphate isomerase [Pseudosphingobacterium sp.]QEL01984.1 KpsF/GutQ family sugar-phosphate isomerase [Olivibacter sp. LS-1]